MTDPTIDVIAAALFGIALINTFAAKQLERLSTRYPRHAGMFHLLGEVEVVFGFWAVVLVLTMALITGGGAALESAESRNYTEPLFVFVVMVVAASRPVLQTVMRTVDALARMSPLPTPIAAAWSGLAKSGTPDWTEFNLGWPCGEPPGGQYCHEELPLPNAIDELPSEWDLGRSSSAPPSIVMRGPSRAPPAATISSLPAQPQRPAAHPRALPR